jgi:hypothetical protein
MKIKRQHRPVSAQGFNPGLGNSRRCALKGTEAEDENDDEDENDWGSGGRELRPTIAGTVCIKAIDQSGQHCNNTRVAFPACFLPQSFSSSFSSSASTSLFARALKNSQLTCSNIAIICETVH